MNGLPAVWDRLVLRVDAWRFASRRADYLEYLHAVLQQVQGGLTIRELFERDALRHGAGTVRGRLSRRWARVCESAGGDLYLTWRGCLPADELALIRAAQSFGNTRLLGCFRALANHLSLLLQAQRLLWSTLGVAAVALLVVSLLWMALPLWTVPALEQAFQGLPEAYQGDWTHALFSVARFLRDWGFVGPLAACAALSATWYALPRAQGPFRRVLDRYGPWRLYRQVQALRAVALIGILLQVESGRSIQLRSVVVLFVQQASPWLASYLDRMRQRIDQGFADVAAFDVGLLDHDLYWYLQDMSLACGLSQALRMTHERMAVSWLPRVRLQAQFLRWTVLLTGVSMVLGVGLWHYVAIDELRRGWMMFHASQ
ncbi:MAG TPA: hypothetical protein VF285_02630 [Castellaniella sp.]|uniref:hypothetical protein n=1 Tax=Castellaniella sp. TaxID=1955812 RepID=UPI002EF287E5